MSETGGLAGWFVRRRRVVVGAAAVVVAASAVLAVATRQRPSGEIAFDVCAHLPEPAVTALAGPDAQRRDTSGRSTYGTVFRQCSVGAGRTPPLEAAVAWAPPTELFRTRQGQAERLAERWGEGTVTVLDLGDGGAMVVIPRGRRTTVWLWAFVDGYQLELAASVPVGGDPGQAVAVAQALVSALRA
ncbi:hypothetical protein QEZ54_35615 [Catellatospora sp. KI3]|uniref:hypothetical protein n=1 Tax=Catellatospora sp. KI3 TaxID=3041620 RepID=UPI002482AF60|nr:hypothetical protein [Catellatospora sp. KI3]MDI1466320.1 hypothetical protein [Catellatospora sp. KI3]